MHETRAHLSFRTTTSNGGDNDAEWGILWKSGTREWLHICHSYGLVNIHNEVGK